MTMNPHEPFEELISASLHGDLTADERRRLDTHLDACDQCRGTLAAFAEERRMIAGLRHVAPPRDLGARVRAGIEYASVPWWRRPTTIFTAVGGTLAAVTGALLALVVLNGAPTGPEVADATPPAATSTPASSASSEPGISSTPLPTLPPPETAAPGETPAPPPTPHPDATANPIALSSPEPDLAIAYQPATPADDESSLAVVTGATGTLVVEPEPPADPADPSELTGEPIAAELSPDGQWLAYVSRIGESGMNQLFATRVAEGIPSDDPEAPPPTDSPIEVGQTVSLGASTAGRPFVDRLAWSSNSAYLHYTLADPETARTDVWRFDVGFGEPRQITEVGNAYAGSWVPGSSGTSMFWISTAGETPISYLHAVHDSAGDPDDPTLGGSLDPAENSMAEVENAFQPLVSPNGALVIYWEGRMAQMNDEWAFSEGGAPYLAEHRPLDEEVERPFHNERALFSDLTIDRESFTSAAITWGLDGDSYAVWETDWAGLSQDPEGGSYPDSSRIYFGHPSDPQGLTRFHAIDAANVPEDWSVIDVKVSPTGRHLVVMVAAPRSGLEAPTAELRLVTRNMGEGDDEVEILESDAGQWYGPAVFDAYVELPDDGAGEEPAASPSESGSP
jgi:anti-sigma factor RsiW